MKVDVSLFPVFEEQTTSLLAELRTIYHSDECVGNKSAKFETVLKKYGCLP